MNVLGILLLLTQVRYGMDERTSYKQQYEQSLERAVRKGDISIVEYHTQKATLQTNDLSGVDDGHSCTKGLLAHYSAAYCSMPIKNVRVIISCTKGLLYHYSWSSLTLRERDVAQRETFCSWCGGSSDQSFMLWTH